MEKGWKKKLRIFKVDEDNGSSYGNQKAYKENDLKINIKWNQDGENSAVRPEDIRLDRIYYYKTVKKEEVKKLREISFFTAANGVAMVAVFCGAGAVAWPLTVVLGLAQSGKAIYDWNQERKKNQISICIPDDEIDSEVTDDDTGLPTPFPWKNVLMGLLIAISGGIGMLVKFGIVAAEALAIGETALRAIKATVGVAGLGAAVGGVATAACADMLQAHEFLLCEGKIFVPETQQYQSYWFTLEKGTLYVTLRASRRKEKVLGTTADGSKREPIELIADEAAKPNQSLATAIDWVFDSEQLKKGYSPFGKNSRSFCLEAGQALVNEPKKIVGWLQRQINGDVEKKVV